MKRLIFIAMAMLTLSATAKAPQTTKDRSGKVEHVKYPTANGYIVKDKNGKIIYKVVETATEVRTYDAQGRIVRVEKKKK